MQTKNHSNISVALDENADITWAIIFVPINDENCNISKEFLQLVSLCKPTTVQ